MAGKSKRRPAPRFLQLHHRLLKSHAWHSLTPLQRCGYIELAQLYHSTNNGRLAMSVRRLAGLIPCNKDSNILWELEDAGFIETVKIGRYTRKRVGTEPQREGIAFSVAGYEQEARRPHDRPPS